MCIKMFKTIKSISGNTNVDCIFDSNRPIILRYPIMSAIKCIYAVLCDKIEKILHKCYVFYEILLIDVGVNNGAWLYSIKRDFFFFLEL